MKKILYVFVVFLFFSTSAIAQFKAFEWNTEMCAYKGEYDSRKYSEEHLSNTARMLFSDEFRGFSMNVKATVWEFSSIADLDVEELDNLYRTKRAELAEMPIIKGEYWEKVRLAKLKEFDGVYELSRVTMLGYTQPERLSDLKWADSCKKKYVEPIVAGGESLIKIWREVNEESRTRNIDPDRLKNRFETELASEDRLQFALVEVMAFGWWNCANTYIKYDNEDFNEREEAFKRLFRKMLVEDCEMP